MTEFERIKLELEEWSQPPGVSPSTLLGLSEPLRSILKQIMRTGSMSFAELADELPLTVAETGVIAELLVSGGLLQTGDEDPAAGIVYRLRRRRPQRREAPAAIWDRLLDDDEGDP